MKEDSKEKDSYYQPDDRFFAEVMSKKDNARAYLEEFYPKVAAIADLDTLALETERFIRPNLKLFRSDIIYRCQFKDLPEHFYFSIIWEHKLQPDEKVAIQLGLYIFLKLYELVKAEDAELVPVLPLLFYNGKKKWIPKTVYQLFKDKPHYDFFEPFLPNFNFLFKNLTEMPPDELLKLQTGFFRSAMMSMAFRHRADLLIENISVIFDVNDKNEQEMVFHYTAAIFDRSPKKFVEKVKTIDFTNKAEVMNVLEYLKTEGRREGKVEGKIEGKIEGKNSEKAFRSLKNLLMLLDFFPNMELDKLVSLTELSEASIKTLKKVIAIKNIPAIKEAIDDLILKGITLEPEEQKEIEQLLGDLVAKKQ
ncbi:MAG: Rpn family recombination-promoting nuclease/putative transposase [Bacteroidota bacterium]